MLTITYHIIIYNIDQYMAYHWNTYIYIYVYVCYNIYII